jgi:hypothetical protein
MNVGKHEIAFEEPDMVRFRVVGDISGRDADGVIDAVMPYAGRRHLLWLIDLTHAGAVDREARRTFGARVRPLPNRAAAFVRGSFAARVVVRMVLHAIRLIARRNNPAEFFDTEETALKWLAEQRRRLGEA